MKKARLALAIIGTIVAIGVVIGFVRPKWVYRVEQISEDDGMRQTDQKWFGVIPNSVVERNPQLSVRREVLAALGRLVKHPAGVDTTKIDYLERTVYPSKSCYVRLNVKGNLKAIMSQYAKQLSLVSPLSPRGGSLLAEVNGVCHDGTKLNLTLWDPTASGHPYNPTEGELAFSWQTK